MAPEQGAKLSAPAAGSEPSAASPAAPAPAWDDDQVPYDDATAASYDEDDLPPFDMPAEQPAPAPEGAASVSAPVPEGAASISATAISPGDAAEGSAADVASILGNVFGEGVKLTQVNGTE